MLGWNERDVGRERERRRRLRHLAAPISSLRSLTAASVNGEVTPCDDQLCCISRIRLTNGIVPLYYYKRACHEIVMRRSESRINLSAISTAECHYCCSNHGLVLAKWVWFNSPMSTFTNKGSPNSFHQVIFAQILKKRILFCFNYLIDN